MKKNMLTDHMHFLRFLGLSRKTSLISVCIMLLFTLNVTFAQIETGSFEFEGLTRDYIVFLPQNFQANMPVVFNLHGWTDNAQWQMEYSAMNDVADTAGFIVVYPNGIYPGFNSDVPDLNLPSHDDIGFISALLDTLDARYQIDLSRVYSCGFSNGGAMTFKLACQLWHRFAAGASIAGPLPYSTMNQSILNRSFPMLLCNGTEDGSVLYNGGKPGISSVEESLNFWLQNNLCLLQADTISLPDLVPEDSCTVDKISYINCADETSILFYKVIHGGHSWPSSTYSGGWSGNTNKDINANVEIWNFFKNIENPFAYIAYGKAIEVYPVYVSPQGDTVFVKGFITNPENHPLHVYAKIHGDDVVFSDSLPLYDDGMHGDENSDDNIWANSKLLSGLDEDLFTLEFYTHDLSLDQVHKSRWTDCFSSEGPITFDHYRITSADTIPHHSDKLKFEFTLHNNGYTAIANNIKSHVVSLDTFSIIYPTVISEYGNILPGSTAFGNLKQYIQFDLSSYDSVDVKFRIDISSDDEFFWSDTFSVFVYKDPSGINTADNNVPEEFILRQNHPNPFNPLTKIIFTLPNPEFVILEIYNTLGQKIETLVNRKMNAGSYNVEFDASDLTSGIYFYRVQAGEFNAVKKMILLR